MRDSYVIPVVVAQLALSSSALAQGLLVDLPGNIDREAVAIVASDSLRINDRVVVAGLNGERVAVVNTGTTETNIGVDAIVDEVLSASSVQLRNRALVKGSVVSGGTIDLQDGAFVDDGAEEFTDFPLVQVADASMIPVGTVDVMIEPDQSWALAPGNYRSIVVKSRARLYLSAGRYNAAQFTLEPDSRAITNSDAGTTELYVRDSMSYKGALEDTSVFEPSAILVYAGTNDVHVERRLLATLVAPNAKVNLASSPEGPHIGSVYARSVEIHQGAHFLATHRTRTLSQAARPAALAITNYLDPTINQGGTGTLDDPHVLLVDNPEFVGSVYLSQGEQASGVEGSWHWETPDSIRYLRVDWGHDDDLNSPYGYYLDPQGNQVFREGRYGFLLPVIPDGEHVGPQNVPFKMRGGNLEPDVTYRARLIEAEWSSNSVLPGISIGSEIWFRLSPRVTVVPISLWTMLDNRPGIEDPEYHMSQMDLTRSVFDYLLPESLTRFGVRHALPSTRAAFNLREGSLPFAHVLRPDDVWQHCLEPLDGIVDSIPRSQPYQVQQLQVVSSLVRDVPEATFASGGGGYPCRTQRLWDVNLSTIEEDLRQAGFGQLLDYTRDIKLIPWDCQGFVGKESGDGNEIGTFAAATDPNVIAHELGHVIIGDPPAEHAHTDDVHDIGPTNLMVSGAYGNMNTIPDLKDYQCARADKKLGDERIGGEFFVGVGEPPWVLCDWTGTPGDLTNPPSEWYLATFATRARCLLEFKGVIIAECGESLESCFDTRAALFL